MPSNRIPPDCRRSIPSLRPIRDVGIRSASMTRTGGCAMSWDSGVLLRLRDFVGFRRAIAGVGVKDRPDRPVDQHGRYGANTSHTKKRKPR